jgi:hypothetical protein
MTPERRQAYTDAGLPLNTGGGFRTMPETEAQRIMRYQRTGSLEGMDKEIGFNPRRTTIGYDPEGEALAERQSASMEDPLLEQERERVGRNARMHSERAFPIMQNIGGKNVPKTEWHSGYGRKRFASEPGEIANRKVQEISNTPKPYKEYLDNLANQKRNKATPLPEGYQGPEQFPPSEFARRGDASASPSDQAFKVMQQRREAAEAHEQVLAERQREMQMNALRNKMRNQPNIQRKQRGRRGQGPNSRKNRMKQRRN